MGAAVSFSALANAKTEKHMEPSSEWALDYAEGACRLARMFGEGDEKVLFYLERYQPGDNFSIVVAGAPFEKFARSDVRIQFGESGELREEDVIEADLGRFSPALMISRSTLDEVEDPESRDAKTAKTDADLEPSNPFDLFGQQISPQYEAAVEFVAIESKRRGRVVLETGSLGEPMKAMRKCTDDLISTWGIDIQAHRSLTRRVLIKGDSLGWVRDSDYPTDLIRKGMQGLIYFRLNVDEEGKPTSCNIQRSTRPEEFDRIVCDRLLERAELIPALNAEGTPIESIFQGAVFFTIPN